MWQINCIIFFLFIISLFSYIQFLFIVKNYFILILNFCEFFYEYSVYCTSEVPNVLRHIMKKLLRPTYVQENKNKNEKVKTLNNIIIIFAIKLN